MESYLFRPTFWEQKKYNGNGSFANSSIFITCVVPLQNEVNTITMDGVFKVRTYKRTSTSQSWTITETTDQVYTSAWLVNAKNVDRKSNIHLGDGVSIDVTQYPDVVKMIFEVNFINTTMFNLHPPDWTPPDDATGEFYALSEELPTFRYDAFVWYMGANGFPTNENIRDEAEYTEPIPLSQWTIKEGYNDGFPFNGLLRDIPYVPPEPSPIAEPHEFYDEYNAEYLRALRQKHRRYKIRVELLGYYENVIGEITKDISLNSSGQVTINNEQITRRSCSLSLIDVEKRYLPSQDNAIWFNRKFKLWIGIEIDKKTYWWSYGVFFTQKASCEGNTVNIQAIDKGGALDGTIKTGMLDTSCIIEANTTLTNLIKDTLMWNEFSSPYLNHKTLASSYPVDPISPIIDPKFNTIRTQNEITINSNDYISTLLSSIADGYGADAYYNTNGHFVFQTMADDSRIDGYRFMAHQWDFSDKDDMYFNASVDFNLDGYNVVTVYTNENDIENVSYTAANNNPTSPLRLDSAGIRRMTDVEIPYVNVPQAEMKARCKAYADYLLMKEAMQGMSITFSCPILPHLDVNRTIGITDKQYNLDHATFVINSITMPLSAESMTINATQTLWLPDNTGIEGGGI